MQAMGDQWKEKTMKQKRKAGGPPPFIDLILGKEHCDLVSILDRSFWLQWGRDFCYKLPVTRCGLHRVKRYEQVSTGHKEVENPGV